MEEQKAEGLQLNTITDSLGVVGSAISNDSADEPLKVTDSLEPFLKELVLATNELVNQFEEISLLQKDMMIDDKRRAAEELSELKAKEDDSKNSSLVEPLETLSTALADLTKLIQETDFGGGGLGLIDIAGAAGAAGAGAAAKRGGFLSGAAKFLPDLAGKLLGKAAVPIAAAFSAFGAYTGFQEADDQLSKNEITEDEAREKKYEAVGGGVGSLGGSLAGAAIGQALIPIPFLGAIAGGIAGGFFGEQLGEFTGESLAKTPELVNSMSKVNPTPKLATTAAVAQPVTINPLNDQSIAVQTEAVEKAESLVEVADPIVMGQTNDQTMKKLETKLYDFGSRDVDDVPDPNYSGGILEEELFP
jgi:hypothetical protein